MAEYYIALLENVVEGFMMNVRDPEMSKTHLTFKEPTGQGWRRDGLTNKLQNSQISVGTSLMVQWLGLYL